MRDYIEFGSKRIDFSLDFSERKTLGITVTPDLEVLVKAPMDSSIDSVKDKLRNKASWIIRQLSFFLAFHPKLTDRKFVGGETHLYLGRQYRLKVIISDDVKSTKDDVKLKGQFLEVKATNKDGVKELVEAWYLNKAKDRFHQIALPLFESFIKRNDISEINYNISIRHMQTRWGSCTAKGKIILNPELIKAPKSCIEYVIIHELCHLVHHDHTQRFLDLQTREMPEWEKWKNKLENLLA